jgi:hypothetical protein
MNEKAIQDFEAAVMAKMQRGMSREQAVNSVRREQPAITQAYLLATNQSLRAQRELSETFDAMARMAR